MTSKIISDNNNGNEIPLVPPQLPPFLANVFNLKPIVSDPSREEVKLVHEAVRALNNFLHAPELRDTDLPSELSQHLFDIQMACHRQKYPVNVLPDDVIYDPPALPNYIHVKLSPVTGPPSNEEVTSVHTALRISEGFVNVPSIFDPDVHVQLSQHLFDIQFARHVQRSVVKRFLSVHPAPQNPTIPDNVDTNSNQKMHTLLQGAAGSTESRHTTLEQPNSFHEGTSSQNLGQGGEPCKTSQLMVEIKNIGETLKNMNRVLIGSQNSLARGFNSSKTHFTSSYNGMSHDLGAHSLINDHGEVPEVYNLPTFKHAGNLNKVLFPLNDFTENQLAQYLRFYSIGEEMIEEGEELKIKSGMVDDARNLLSRRIYLNQC